MIVAALITGVIAAAAATRVLAAQLYGVAATGPRWSFARYEHVDNATRLYGIGAMDLQTVAVTMCILIASTFAAANIPSTRAAQVGPAATLRKE